MKPKHHRTAVFGLFTILVLTVLALAPEAAATHELPAPVIHWKLDETTGTDGANVLLNPGFETWTVTPGAPEQWISNDGAGSQYTKETTIVHGGTNAAKITSDGVSGFPGLYQEIVGDDKSYYVEIWVRGDGVGGYGAIVKFEDITNVAVVKQFSQVSVATWTKQSFTFYADSGSTYRMIVFLVGSTAGRVAYVDDSLIKEIQAKDDAGTSHATLTGVTNGLGPTIGASGQHDEAYIFDGTQWGFDPSPAGLASGSGAEWSMTAWVYFPVLEGEHFGVVMSYGGVLEDGFAGHSPYFATNSSGLVYGSGGENSVFTNQQLPEEEWSFVAVTSDGQEIFLYHEGQLVDSFTPALNAPHGGNASVGGFIEVEGIGWIGGIDDARFYDVGLSDWQVMDLYLNPEHHDCIATYASFSQSLAAPAINLALVMGILGALGVAGFQMRKKFGLMLLLVAVAGVGLINTTPTVSAAHHCAYTSGSTTVDVFLPLLLGVAFVAAWIIVIVRAAHSSKER